MYDHLNSDLTYSRRYSADIAQNDYNQKAAVKGAPLKISNNIKLANYIEKEIIKNHYSPAVVISTIQTKTGRKPFCVSTLYSYIDKGIFLNLTNKHLWEKSKAKTRKKNPVRAKRAPAGTSIEHRPKKYCLETHSVIGKWTLFTANLKAKNKLFLS